MCGQVNKMGMGSDGGFKSVKKSKKLKKWTWKAHKKVKNDEKWKRRKILRIFFRSQIEFKEPSNPAKDLRKAIARVDSPQEGSYATTNHLSSSKPSVQYQPHPKSNCWFSVSKKRSMDPEDTQITKPTKDISTAETPREACTRARWLDRHALTPLKRHFFDCFPIQNSKIFKLI